MTLKPTLRNIQAVEGVCDFLGSVLSQQKFETTDGPMFIAEFYWQAKGNTSSRREGALTQKTRREEKPLAQFWLLFSRFSLPLSCPVETGLARRAVFYLRSSLRSSDLLLLRFPFSSLLCLLVTATLESFFLF